MPDVGIIDGDADGPDNRPSGETPWTDSAGTDEDGKATVTFTVSMQPGNNYRAGASVLQDAIEQSHQTTADALGHTFAGGYSVPVVWSPMLTVWRKLHVEVDSMSMVDESNTQTAIIPSAPTFDPSNNHAMIPLAGLQDDFKKPDQHKVGRMASIVSKCQRTRYGIRIRIRLENYGHLTLNVL